MGESIVDTYTKKEYYNNQLLSNLIGHEDSNMDLKSFHNPCRYHHELKRKNSKI